MEKNVLIRCGFLIISFGIITSPFAKNGPYVVSTYSNGEIDSSSQLMEPTEKLESGSISKYLCTLSVLNAVLSGKVELDAPASKYIPSWHINDKNAVTVRMLLANRSGIKNNINQTLKANPAYPLQQKQTEKAFKDLVSPQLAFTPNGRFDYEVSNWLVVQLLLENVFQEDITTILHKTVFSPAKMKMTSTFSGNLVSRNEAISSASSRPMPTFFTCAGGIKTTAPDLIKMAQFFFEYFPEKLRYDAMNYTTANERYSLGGRYKRIKRKHESFIISHQSGKNGQFRSGVIYIPQLDNGIAVMTADDSLSIESIQKNWLSSQGFEIIDPD